MRSAFVCQRCVFLIGLVLWRSLFAAPVIVDAPEALAFLQRQYGDSAVPLGERWLKQLQTLKESPIDEQLRDINNFWNSNVRESTDAALWKQDDYWATPLESLGRRAGDCEDFVIGKYVSLRSLGIPSEMLRFIYVRATVSSAEGERVIAHMVLGYYSSPDADPLVLDSLVNDIVPGSRRDDLVPVFSFNADGIYISNQQKAPAERIGRWSNLLERMKVQGLVP